MTRPVDFWSRRKAQVAAEEEAAARAAQVDQDIAAAERSDAEICAELGLPDPDTLVGGDDFSGFMARAVPEPLRRRALRRLWRSNPVLANLDGMIDYGEDFTDSACVIEGMQTAYQVGKGMLAHINEMTRQAEAKAVVEEAEPLDEPVADAAPEPQSAPQEAAPVAMAEVEAEAPPPSRRMRFAFAEATGACA